MQTTTTTTTRLRTIELTESVQWPFNGNVIAAAVAVGDVDNDGHNEFVVGSVKGVLAVFKGMQTTRPWRTCANLGTIACIAVGDILNVHRVTPTPSFFFFFFFPPSLTRRCQNMIVCLTVEGWCHVFDILPEEPELWSAKTRETVVLAGPTLTMPLPVNVARCAIGDMDGDGLNELIISHTDRNLEIFRFHQSKSSSSADASRVDFVQVHAVQLPGQSGSIVVLDNNVTAIAQPGGAYVTLDAKLNFQTETAPTEPEMGYFRGGAATELVALHNNRVVVTSVDGTIKMLFDAAATAPPSSASSKPSWELQVNQQLFSLARIDINGDGQPEAAACSWDGMTYFIDANCDIVRFQVGDDVCAFAAGLFAHSPEHSSQCLFYINYADQITVFHDVHVNYVAMRTFVDVLQQEFPSLEISPDSLRRLVYEINC